MKSHLLLAALLCTVAPVMANPTLMDMPEGSREVYLSLAAGVGPRAEGAQQRETFVSPLISARWSNGVFVDMNTVGVHLADSAMMEYGLMATPTKSSVTTYSASGRTTRSKYTPELGGFLKYDVAHGIRVSSSLMYGGSHDHRGLNLRLAGQVWMRARAHHVVGVTTGIQLANRAGLQANFGVTPDQADEFGLPVHEVSGGARNMMVRTQWQWQFSNKYSLSTFIEWQRLLGSAAASPRVEQPAGIMAVTVLTYRF